jgi:hypothetical protein
MKLDVELADALRPIRARQDIVPFLGRWLSVSEAEFRLLPDDMLAILSRSPDFSHLVPGNDPTALQLETDGANAEIVVYRALADCQYYVLAPLYSARSGG